MFRLMVPAVFAFAYSCTSTPAKDRPDAGPPQVAGAGASASEGALGGSDAGVVRFVVVGDTGKGDANQARVGAAMASVCAAQGCDFAVLLGDNFYPTGVRSTTDEQWQTAFVQPYAGIHAPFYAVLGNHDYGGGGAGNEFEVAKYEIAYSLVNPKWRMPAAHYRWSYGPVEFFAADTNRSMFGADEQVTADFKAWLPASTATWKIALGHHPYLSNGTHGNAGTYDGHPEVPVYNGKGVKAFLDEAVCGKADVYLSGHDHSRQWLVPRCGSTELIVSGAGSSRSSLPGTNPTAYQSLGLGFLYVVIDGRTFTATFYDDQGAANFTRTLTR